MISILLPTIRPQAFMPSFESLRLAAAHVPYEIIIVADFAAEALHCHDPYHHLHCRWIESERRGVVDAVNVAYAAARGTHIFLFNDQSILEPEALDTLYEESRKTPEQIVSPKHLPEFNFAYYGLPFVPFPFARKALLDGLGGLLDPAYKGFYADPDLSMRAHAKAVPLRVVPEAVLWHCNEHDAPHQASVRQYLDADRATFRARWDHLGRFIDP